MMLICRQRLCCTNHIWRGMNPAPDLLVPQLPTQQFEAVPADETDSAKPPNEQLHDCAFKRADLDLITQSLRSSQTASNPWAFSAAPCCATENKKALQASHLQGFDCAVLRAVAGC